MKRVLLAVAVFLTATASPTFAGYIIIRVLLEGGGGPPTPGGPAGPAGPGPMPMGPGPGTGGRPSGPGSAGGPPGGPTSSIPASPTSGMPMGATVGLPAGEIDHTRAVVAVIPLETDLIRGRLDMSKNFHPEYNPEFRKFVVQYHGRELKSSLFVDSSTIHLYQELIAQPKPRQTRATEMREAYLNWQKGKNDPQLLYRAMILALESGFIRDTTFHKDNSPPKDAMTFAQELLDVTADKKLPQSDAVKQFIAAWEPMSKAVKSPAPQQSSAENWRIQLDAKNVRVEGHYAIVYWDSQDPEVVRRSAQLNDNFSAFFLWHATRGIVLPVPDKPLIVILAADAREQISQLRFALDGMPTQSDAFYAPDHNIVVLAPERMDDVGRTFLKQTNQVFSKGLNREELLNGKIPKIDPTGEKGSKPEDVARANTLAVVEKLVIEESELAAVSREGTRQLLFAAGVLPKHVTLPNWLTQGAVNVFTRPRGPAYVTIGDNDKPYMTVAMSTGYGVPNYVLHRYFRDMETKKELNADPSKLLENILTDAYFAGLKDGIDPDPAPPAKKKPGGIASVGPPETGTGPRPSGPGGPTSSASMPMGMGSGALGQPGVSMTDHEDPIIMQRKKRERLNIKSQATAWALFYYLSRARTDLLNQYIAELNKLPRDLPIDGRTAHAAFVRVFKLSATEDGPADPALMKKFANGWLDYMKTVPAVGIDIPLVVPEQPKAGPAGPAGPGPGPGPGAGSGGKPPGGSKD